MGVIDLSSQDACVAYTMSDGGLARNLHVRFMAAKEKQKKDSGAALTMLGGEHTETP
jgi:hypothetical protein